MSRRPAVGGIAVTMRPDSGSSARRSTGSRASKSTPGDGARRWPNRSTNTPSVRAAPVVAGVGAVLFVVSAVLVRLDATAWDASAYALLNEVPSALARGLTPISRIFLPIGLGAAIVLATTYTVARGRSALPLLVVAASAGLAWAAANVAKAIETRPRPYEMIADAVLRQDPAHGTSFPSAHTAVAYAVAIALIPFLPRTLAVAGIVYASLVGWSRIYLGVHYPLDVIAGAGIGIAVGGLTLAVLARVLRWGDVDEGGAARSDA